MKARRPSWRRAGGPGLILVLLALLTQLILPPGTMPGTGRGAPIVLCTGHGPVSAPDPAGDHDRQDGARHACPFAHHGLISPTPDAPPIARAAVRYALVDPAPAARPSPGRGLAAPPPPSHAPPLTLAT